MNLLSSLQQQLKQQPMLPFVDFMQLALYAPQEGYYSSGLMKFGSQGDFITAPELTPLFGQTLANQCQQVFATLEKPELLEFGAGTGRLCVDLLTQLEHLQQLPNRYLILEVSSQLRQRQQALILDQIPHLADRVHWLDRWPEQPIQGVMIANEVLDAMPVHRFLKTATDWLESVVSLDAKSQLIEQFQPCTNARLIAYLQQALPDLPYPYQSEVNLLQEDWLKGCAAALSSGALLIIDYGFPRHEFYHPDRHNGTLMCHYQHRAHSNPLIHVGEQDITAHIDFTHVAEAGHAAGFHVAGYTNQASFLLANGLLSLVKTDDDAKSLLKTQQALKILLQPSEMGELFKVIALTKNIDYPLQGFQMHDKRASL